MESRHVSIWIEAAPEVVYAFASDPQTWPQWAAGLAAGGLRQTRGRLGGRLPDG